MEAAALIVRKLSRNGGTERFVWGLCNWLKQRQIQFVVYCQGVEDPIDGVSVVEWPSLARGRVLKLFEMDHYAKQVSAPTICSFVRAGNPTVFRSGGGSHRAWMTINGSSIADQYEAYLERRVFRTASSVIVNSDMARQQLLLYHPWIEDKIKLLRNPIDLHRFQPRSAPSLPGEPALCFVGNNFSRKGLDVAISCLSFFPKAQLSIFGLGAQKKYKAIIERQNLRHRVHFMGVVPSENVLSGADICLLPTLYDPSANVVGEALACGVPVITTSQNGASEILPAPELVIKDQDQLGQWKLAIEWVMSQTEWIDRCRIVAKRYDGEKIYESFWDMAKRSASTD